MKIFVDFDQTLVDLHTPWIDWIKENFGKEITHKEIAQWGYVFDVCGDEVGNFYRDGRIYHNKIDPIPESQIFVKEIQSIYGKENVFIISYCKDTNVQSKRNLAKKLFDVEEENFISAFDKWKYTRNSILIDDNSTHILNHISNNKYPGIIFDYFKCNSYENMLECKILNICHSYESVLNTLKYY